MRTYCLFLLAALAIVSLTFPRLAIAVVAVVLAGGVAMWAAGHFRRRWGEAVLFGLILVIATAGQAPAWAQEVATTKVSLAPVAELLGFAGLAILGFATFLLNAAYARFTAWTGIEVEATQRAAVLDCVRRGVFFGLGKVEDLLGGAAIDVRSTVVAEALNYTLARMPAAVRALGLTDDGLRDIAMAMFSEVQNARPTSLTLPLVPVSA